MTKLEIKIGDELHRVVYIDYNKGIPHLVYTISFIDTSKKPYWRLYSWDFFANNGDSKDIRAYNSGSGGSHKEIQAPQWCDGYIGKYWLAQDAKFKGKTKNAVRLKNPISIQGYYSGKSINPFKVSETTGCMEFCEICGYDSTEFCNEHKYIDQNGSVKYNDDI